LQNAHAAAWLVAVTAEMDVCCIRADDGDALVLRSIQRQQMILIFQQDDGFPGSLERQLLMFRVIGDSFSVLGINKRIVEKSREKFFAKKV
jgi:hypothetical protein